MSFCAICLRDYDGPRRESIGKADAAVAVCDRCATEVVDVRGLRASRGSLRRAPRDERAAQIRERRDQLTADGLCMYGKKHGPVTNGRLCANCYARNKGRDFRRRRTA